MSLTAKEVQEKIEEYTEGGEYEGYGNFYEYIKDEGIDWRTKKPIEIQVPGLPTIKFEDDFGGEGEGDDYWVVFSVGNQYFRVNGYYASYHGGELDGSVEEVKPVKVERIEYEEIKND